MPAIVPAFSVVLRAGRTPNPRARDREGAPDTAVPAVARRPSARLKPEPPALIHSTLVRRARGPLRRRGAVDERQTPELEVAERPVTVPVQTAPARRSEVGFRRL